MDFDNLVNEIVARVAQKLAEAEPGAVVQDDKPRLLVLTQEHGDFCHTMLESARIGQYYQTECALMKEYQCDPAAYEAAILFGLTNDVLGKLAGGVCDTPFTLLAQRLILSGKRIFVPEEDVELFAYRDTAPPAYYAMLESKLTLLGAAGLTICPRARLEDEILGGGPVETCIADVPVAASAPVTTPAPAAAPAPGIEAALTKRIVSEKDAIAACAPGVTVLRVVENAILTDLARDYVKSRRIKLIRG